MSRTSNKVDNEVQDVEPTGLFIEYLIGVNRINIYSVFLMCLCNLNARFTSLFVNITLIPHLFEFCRY